MRQRALVLLAVAAVAASFVGHARAASLAELSQSQLDRRLDWQLGRLAAHQGAIRWHLNRGVVAPRGRPAVAGTPRYRVWWHEQAVRWTRREITETRFVLTAKQKAAIASAFPRHHDLWLCIHGNEGAWQDHDSGGNGHYGGLQMYPGWLGYFDGTADQFSQAQQEQFAERGYADSGYSRSWLGGQWGQTIGPCWQYAD